MANISEKTIGNLLIIQVDQDPSVDGVEAPVGSLALLDNGVGGIWLKRDNPTDTAWSPLAVDSPSVSSGIFDDWINSSGAGNLGWRSTANAGGSQIVPNTNQVDQFHSGVVTLSAGAYTDGLACLDLGLDRFTLGGGPLSFEFLIQLPSLAVSSDSYILRLGLGDSRTGDFSNGIYFEYDNSSFGDFWTANAYASGMKTSVVSSVQVLANTWFRLNVMVNAAGSSVTFFVASSGGASASIGTITTNIPNSPGERCGPVVQLSRGGLTSASVKSLYLDYFSLNQTLTNPR